METGLLIPSDKLTDKSFSALVRTDSVPGGDQRWSSLLGFQSITPGDYFEFTPDRILNVDHGVHLEHK